MARVKCPHCRSSHVAVLDTNTEKISWGKTAAKATLLGPFALFTKPSKKKAAKFVCQNCGKVFKAKTGRF